MFISVNHFLEVISSANSLLTPTSLPGTPTGVSLLLMTAAPSVVTLHELLSFNDGGRVRKSRKDSQLRSSG